MDACKQMQYWTDVLDEMMDACKQMQYGADVLDEWWMHVNKCSIDQTY